MAESRSKVLSLYRNILRTGRTWSGKAEEKEYIWSEATSQFRRNAAATDPDLIKSLINEGETRLEYAVHYGIPYPRLHHAPQFKKRYFMDAPHLDSQQQQQTPSARDSDVAAKLAAAAERRRQKLDRAKRGDGSAG